MFFNDLDDDIKDAITGFRFTVYSFEDITDKQLEEIFELINNASPLSTVQKTKAALGTELAVFMNGILELSFWSENIKLTEAQLKKESNLLMLEQSALLLQSKLGGYKYNGVSASEVRRFCRAYRNNFSDSLKELLEEVSVFLSEVFKGKGIIKYLKPNNVCIIFQVANLAYKTSADESISADEGISEEDVSADKYVDGSQENCND